jgi:hypothetical protein
MRLAKALAIAVGVLIVFFVVSALVHVLYLIGVGLVVAAAIFFAFKAWERYKQARQRSEERHEERMQRRAERSPGRSIEPRPRQYPGTTGTAASQPAASGNLDIEEELARLKRDMN